MTRREFLAPAATTAAYTLVPRHVLGGRGYVPPSDKVTLAHIGCGTEGTRELLAGLIQDPQVQIVAVCDPVKDGTNYLDWSKNGIRDRIRKVLQYPTFGEGVKGIRAGRDQFQEIVERYYAKSRGAESYKGCSSYADFRELLEKERDIDAVKIITPDHLHAAIAIAAMKKGKHVIMHKPVGNRMTEARLVIEIARNTKVVTHLMAYLGGGAAVVSADVTTHSVPGLVAARIREGVIGPLREVHNWWPNPVWPQYTQVPTERPPVPEGFDWQLWLGPERDRPYHPCYTHMVFRSWYDFGGGSIADVGIYSLWPVFTALDLGPPISARAWATHTCNVVDQVANAVVNDFSYPTASVIQFQYAARADWPALDVFWYDGGMQPRIPELDADNTALPPAGMLWVGDKGKILVAGEGVPRLIAPKSESLWTEESFIKALETTPGPPGGGIRRNIWVPAIKRGEPAPGDFLGAGSISETVCLAQVALRAGRIVSGVRSFPAAIKLLYDSANMKITNLPEANKYLTRDYRPGWEL